jgi:pilus assembly protein CpaC
MTAQKTRLFARVAAAAMLIAVTAVTPAALAQNTAQNTAPTSEKVTLIQFKTGGPPQKLSLPINNGAVIEVDRDVRDVFIARPQIVDATVRTARRVLITAAAIGTTNVILLDANGGRVGTLEVTVGVDVADLNEQMAMQFAGSNAKAEVLGDAVVLSGTVASAAQASEARNMAQRLVAGQAARVVNNLRVEQPSQVMIQVRVAEMTRTIAKQFGVNVAGGIGQAADGTPLFSARTHNQFGILGRALAELSGVALNCTFLTGTPSACGSTAGIGNTPEGLVQALERLGLMRSLAEPNLTAVSGESARFLVGGEFPVPTSRDRDGNILVVFKPFGVGLSFTPVVLDRGHISLQISTEVSELSPANSFTIEGLTIPGLSVRRAETTVELPSGGSLVIGGLLQQTAKQSIDGFPGLKDLPILGALFRSRDFQNNETELVVMVTAYLVDPVVEARLAKPTDGFVLPTDLQTIIQGRLSAVYGSSAASPPPGAPRNAVGYIID